MYRVDKFQLCCTTTLGSPPPPPLWPGVHNSNFWVVSCLLNLQSFTYEPFQIVFDTSWNALSHKRCLFLGVVNPHVFSQSILSVVTPHCSQMLDRPFVYIETCGSLVNEWRAIPVFTQLTFYPVYSPVYATILTLINAVLVVVLAPRISPKLVFWREN